MADSNCYYRRNAILEVGGFNEELQVMENVEVSWKLRKAGYKIKSGGKDVVFFHHRSIDQFTLGAVLGRAFTYGYYWHKLHHIHPDKTGLSSMPVKTMAFAMFILLSYFHPYTLWALFAAISFWFIFKIYRDRARVTNCITKMKGKIEKAGALIFIVFTHMLYETTEELGKLYSTLRLPHACMHQRGNRDPARYDNKNGSGFTTEE